MIALHHEKKKTKKAKSDLREKDLTCPHISEKQYIGLYSYIANQTKQTEERIHRIIVAPEIKKKTQSAVTLICFLNFSIN